MTQHPLRAALAAALTLLAPLAAHAQTAAPAPAAAPSTVWDLQRLFADDAAWDAERRALLAELPGLQALKGTVGRDAASLRAVLDRQSALRQRLQRVAVYASTQLSTDSRVPRNQERSAQLRSAFGQLSAAGAWLAPEVQALGAERVEAFLRGEPGLARHAVALRDMLRLAPHTLGAEAEAALAAVSPVINAPTNLRTMLLHADAKWPTMVVDGKTVRLNDIGYQELRTHPDRQVRKQAFDQFYQAYGQLENTLGGLLAARVEAGVVQARLRRHPTAVAASLSSTQVPETVLRTLVAEVNKGLPVLHRYLRLRQTMLGLSDLHYYDVYPDPLNSERRYSLAQSSALTLAAIEPLGPDYRELLRQAVSAPTMHVHPAEGKQSGAYQSGVYGQLPFVFLNHRDSWDSLLTFAHEWGHGVHSMLAQRTQPFETAGYSLFVAETASITNEVLMFEHMLGQAATRQERLFVLTQQLERLRAAFFRQAMFAEFELRIHDAQERGEPLSGQRFGREYCELLRKYHGTAQGVMAIDPAYCREWAIIPHFHRPFYVYVYATSTVAAEHFGRQVLERQPGAQARYLDLLRAGGSVPPYALFKAAGLDLATPGPYEALLRRMNEIIDEVERLLVPA